jgi:hypothetical protein
MVDQHPFLLEALTWVNNNTFPFQQHFKATCDVQPPPTYACLPPFEQLIGQQMVQLQNSISKHLHHHTLSNMLCERISESVATLTWPSVGVKPNTWKSWAFGVLRDSRMFRARQQDPKHLALGCSWCHWKGLEA